MPTSRQLVNTVANTRQLVLALRNTILVNDLSVVAFVFITSLVSGEKFSDNVLIIKHQ